MGGRGAVLVVGVILLLAHQDFWAWDDATLVGGVMPVGLAYHGAYSVAAALFGLWLTREAWPGDPLGDEEQP